MARRRVGDLRVLVLILFAIFFHELGHFLTARWAGIKVIEVLHRLRPDAVVDRRGRLETVTIETATAARDGHASGDRVRRQGVAARRLREDRRHVAARGGPAGGRAARRSRRRRRGSARSCSPPARSRTSSRRSSSCVLIFVVGRHPGPGQADARRSTPSRRRSTASRRRRRRPGSKPGDEIVAVERATRSSSSRTSGRAMRARGGKPVTLRRSEKADGARVTVTIRPIARRRSAKPAVPVIGIYPKNELARQNPIAARRCRADVRSANLAAVVLRPRPATRSRRARSA